MKKTLFTLMLMLASVVAVNAQSITSSSWMAVEDEVAIMFDFQDNGACTVAFAGEEVEEEAGVKIRFTMAAMVPGTYTLYGNVLNLKLDSDKSDINIDYSVEGMDAETKKMLDAYLLPELEKEKPKMKKELLEELPWDKTDAIKVISISNDKLVLADEDGEQIILVAVPKK